MLKVILESYKYIYILVRSTNSPPWFSGTDPAWIAEFTAACLLALLPTIYVVLALAFAGWLGGVYVKFGLCFLYVFIVFLNKKYLMNNGSGRSYEKKFFSLGAARRMLIRLVSAVMVASCFIMLTLLPSFHWF